MERFISTLLSPGILSSIVFFPSLFLVPSSVFVTKGALGSKRSKLLMTPTKCILLYWNFWHFYLKVSFQRVTFFWCLNFGLIFFLIVPILHLKFCTFFSTRFRNIESNGRETSAYPFTESCSIASVPVFSLYKPHKMWHWLWVTLKVRFICHSTKLRRMH